jgi:aminopeptidase N
VSTQYRLGKSDPVLGQALTIGPIPAATRVVRVQYSTTHRAGGLNWIDAPLTEDKKFPLLYTAGEPIQTRSWIPCQDSPSVRVTYDAEIQTDAGLIALMGGDNPKSTNATGKYLFKMRHPVPSYLIALLSGGLEYRATGPRSGVYAEPSVVQTAAKQFDDSEKMIQVAEKLIGPYLWDDFNLAVLPPNFAYGGMENPNLIYVARGIVTGAKDFNFVVTHELSHFWTGNLVTNATWNEMWLNEGLTSYLENRLAEAMYGREFASFNASSQEDFSLVEIDGMKEEKRLHDSRLTADYTGKDPSLAFNGIPYGKGPWFLRELERKLGRSYMDGMLQRYVAKFAWKSITSNQFKAFIFDDLRSYGTGTDARDNAAFINEWMHGEGIPAFAKRVDNPAARALAEMAQKLADGELLAEEINIEHWSSLHWSSFISSLNGIYRSKRAQNDYIVTMVGLDSAFSLAGSTDPSVIGFYWGSQFRFNPRPPQLLKEFSHFILTSSQANGGHLQSFFSLLLKNKEETALARKLFKMRRSSLTNGVADPIDQMIGEAEKKFGLKL